MEKTTGSNRKRQRESPARVGEGKRRKNMRVEEKQAQV